MTDIPKALADKRVFQTLAIVSAAMRTQGRDAGVFVEGPFTTSLTIDRYGEARVLAVGPGFHVRYRLADGPPA